MGPVGSPFSKVGIEITDSIYVVLNMNIMTRVGKAVLDVLGDSNDWVRGMHCKCNVDPEKRWIWQIQRFSGSTLHLQQKVLCSAYCFLPG